MYMRIYIPVYMCGSPSFRLLLVLLSRAFFFVVAVAAICIIGKAIYVRYIHAVMGRVSGISICEGWTDVPRDKYMCILYIGVGKKKGVY